LVCAAGVESEAVPRLADEGMDGFGSVSVTSVPRVALTSATEATLCSRSEGDVPLRAESSQGQLGDAESGRGGVERGATKEERED